MNQSYVHVRLFEDTAEQTKKSEELMSNFLYQKTVKESNDSCCRPAPEGYILKSTMNCQQIFDQTFSIANSAGVDANIFVYKLEQNACLLPSASLVGNDFAHYDLTPKPIRLDSQSLSHCVVINTAHPLSIAWQRGECVSHEIRELGSTRGLRPVGL